jgi:hypothetical protein
MGIQLLPTPIFAYLIYKVNFFFKGYRNKKWFKLLFSLFAVPLFFFLYKALFKKMELNWPVIAFLAPMPVLAVYLAEEYSNKLFRIGAIFATVCTVFLLILPFVSLPISIDLSLRIKETKNAVDEFKRITAGSLTDTDALFSDHLTVASMLTYYLEGQPRVYIPLQSKYSQYSIWDNGTDFNALSGYVLARGNKLNELMLKFPKVEFIKRFSVDSISSGSGGERFYYIYYVSGGKDEKDSKRARDGKDVGTPRISTN